jgi:hypothetical protein
LVLFWTLFCGSTTWNGVDGDYKTLAACITEGKRQVELADARRAEFEAGKAAIQKAHPGEGVISQEDYNVQWECRPSDGSTPTYGGYWKTKHNRPQS